MNNVQFPTKCERSRVQLFVHENCSFNLVFRNFFPYCLPAGLLGSSVHRLGNRKFGVNFELSSLHMLRLF